MLNEVTHLWGGTTLIESDPAEEFCHLAIYIPFKADVYFEQDPDWGLYDRGGALVRAAAHYRGPNDQIVGQSAATQLPRRGLEIIEEPLVYCGPFMTHYGHFLTTTLPRFWSLAKGERRQLRFLCHAHQPPDQWFEYPFVAQTLGPLGIGPERFVWLDRPAAIRRLWVPRPAMREQQFVHRALDSIARIIGQAHGVHLEARGDRPVYLSKTRLASGITRFEEEEKLEHHLSTRGFEIAYPEQLPFGDQLRLLARARAITGTLGSGFHASMFLTRPSRIVALAPYNTLNSNYVLIDMLKGNNSVYLYSSMPTSARSGDGSFQTVWTIENLSAAAEEYADLV